METWANEPGFNEETMNYACHVLRQIFVNTVTDTFTYKTLSLYMYAYD